jgi:hypothetical protein
MSRHHEMTRVEAFSDAVFAFALTLLVVSLEVPKTMDELLNLLRGFLPFAAMFAMVCWIWYQHNVYFRRYGLQDATTAALNSFLLFVVLFYVYPLKFLAVGGLGRLVGMRDIPVIADGRVVMELYSTGVVLIFGTFVLFYGHAWRRRRDLDLSPTDEIALRYTARGHVFTMTIGLLSLTLARFLPGDALAPAVAGFVYFGLGVVHTLNGVSEGRAKRRLERIKDLASDR